MHGKDAMVSHLLKVVGLACVEDLLILDDLRHLDTLVDFKHAHALRRKFLTVRKYFSGRDGGKN